MNKEKPTGVLIFGIHAVLEMLQAKRRKLIAIYTTKPTPKAWSKIEQVLPKYPYNTQYVTRDVLTKMIGSDDHQGIIAWVQDFPIRKKMFDAQKSPFLLMLDGIQDVGNLGAILRSAYCAGVDGVILCKKNSASLQAAVFKASAGLAEYLDIYEAASAQAAVIELKEAGYTIYLTTFDGQDASKCSYTKPLCLVIGNEATGISDAILKSGVKITLPQRRPDISYNASVAAGISLFLVTMKTNL